MLVDHLDAHVLQLRQHVGQDDGAARPVYPQPPVAVARAAVVAQPDRERVIGLAQSHYPAEVTDGVGRGHVGLVGLGDSGGELVQDQPRPLLTQGAHRLLFQVLVPRADRRGDPPLQRHGIDDGQWPAALAAHDNVQPGQGRFPHHRAVVDGGPAQSGPQGLLDLQPDGGGVPVPGQIDQAGHVPPVGVPAQEQPGLLALAQPQHGHGDLGQLAGGDLEQLLARIVLQNLDQVVAVVALGSDPGPGQHVGQLAAQHRDAGDALGVGGVRIQAEEPPLADHPAIPAQLLDRHVVEVLGPVDGGPGIALGQYQPVRIAGLGPDVGGQRRERVRALPIVAQEAEPGARDGPQRLAVIPRHQVVLAVAEEDEVPVGEPAEQLTGFGVAAGQGLRLGAPRQRCAGPVPGHGDGQGGRGRDHLGLVFDGDPHVVQDAAQPGREVGQRDAVPQAGELDVDPGLGDLPRLRPGTVDAAGHVVQHAGNVPAHHQPRVQEQRDVGLMPVQFHGHRIDQERHVVGDDVDHGPDRAEPHGRAAWAIRGPGIGATDADQGPALRALRGEGRVLGGDRGDPVRAVRGEVLRGNVPVVGAQVSAQVTDASAAAGTRGLGQVLCRLIQHIVVRFVRSVRHRCLFPMCPRAAARGRRDIPASTVAS